MRHHLTLALGLAAMLALTGPASAGVVIEGITWYDVDDSRSTVASGAIETDGFDGADGDKTDANWDYTTPFGVIGAGDTDARGATDGTGMLANVVNEDPGKLTFTASGALDSSKSYTVYVAFRLASDQEGLELSLDDSNWTQSTGGGQYDLSGNLLSAGTTELGQDANGTGNPYVYVTAGVGTVTGTSDLTVYFRDPTTDNPDGGGAFTWSIIDAVGVVPEPGTLALLGLGGLGGLARRRRRMA
jgi:hypothetical protein